jgi:hypothetical protein
MKRFRNWWDSNSFRRAVAKKRAQRRAAAGLSSPSPSPSPSPSRADDIYPPWLYGEGAEPVNMPPQTAAAIAALGLHHFEGMGGSAGGAGASVSYGAPDCQPTGESSPTGFTEAAASHSSNDSGGYSDSGSSCSSDSGSSDSGSSGGGD